MPKVGRNDPCPCGSGKKYKKCCQARDEVTRATTPPGPPAGGSFLASPRPWPQLPPDAVHWPVVRAFVPVDAVWRATGMGTAGIVRRRPDGQFVCAIFVLSLIEGGISMMFGRPDGSADEIDALVADTRDLTPPSKEGPPELASAFIWGAWALGEKAGHGFPPEQMSRFLEFVPKPPGSPAEWLARLGGPGGLTPEGLIDLLDALPDGSDVPEGRELAIPTFATLRVTDRERVERRLRDGACDAKGFRFVVAPPAEIGELAFDWARPIPEGPLSIAPIRGGLQVQGEVRLTEDALFASSLSLSMMARLLGGFETLLGDAITLVDTQWVNPRELTKLSAVRSKARRSFARRG